MQPPCSYISTPAPHAQQRDRTRVPAFPPQPVYPSAPSCRCPRNLGWLLLSGFSSGSSAHFATTQVLMVTGNKSRSKGGYFRGRWHRGELSFQLHPYFLKEPQVMGNSVTHHSKMRALGKSRRAKCLSLILCLTLLSIHTILHIN